MRKRSPVKDFNWGTICTPVEILAPDGKRRKTNCSNTQGVFRIFQSISSPKADPFKRWLAKVSDEWKNIAAHELSGYLRFAHAFPDRFSPVIRMPSLLRYERICAMITWGGCSAVLTTISGLSGGSYGSLIPVKPFIWPMRAFL